MFGSALGSPAVFPSQAPVALVVLVVAEAGRSRCVRGGGRDGGLVLGLAVLVLAALGCVRLVLRFTVGGAASLAALCFLDKILTMKINLAGAHTATSGHHPPVFSSDRNQTGAHSAKPRV